MCYKCVVFSGTWKESWCQQTKTCRSSEWWVLGELGNKPIQGRDGVVHQSPEGEEGGWGDGVREKRKGPGRRPWGVGEEAGWRILGGEPQGDVDRRGDSTRGWVLRGIQGWWVHVRKCESTSALDILKGNNIASNNSVWYTLKDETGYWKLSIGIIYRRFYMNT